MKYIEAEKLRNFITERFKVCPISDDERHGRHCALIEIEGFIDDLQQEQLEMDVVSAAKVFLDALSKIPYNNRPITDAQIIVKQLLIFFENPSKYNPDAIVEHDVDALKME